MPTSKETIESLRQALALAPEVTFLPLMGEYSVYSRGRVFGMVCQDVLFFITTPETLHYFTDRETRAFPGSENTCRANAEWLTDPEKLGEVVLFTLVGLTSPRPAAGGRRKPPAAAAPPSGGRWLSPGSLEKLLGAGAAFAALYFLLPYGLLSAIGIHKGPKADNFAVTGLRGEKTRLSDCGGKPVFLYVWESNSQRALDNLPLIAALYDAYKEKGVCFMPVTITADFNCAVRALAAAKDLKYPVYNGAGQPAAQLRPPRSPMLYLLDHKGYVREAYCPSSGDLQRVSADLEDLLRETRQR